MGWLRGGTDHAFEALPTPLRSISAPFYQMGGCRRPPKRTPARPFTKTYG